MKGRRYNIFGLISEFLNVPPNIHYGDTPYSRWVPRRAI